MTGFAVHSSGLAVGYGRTRVLEGVDLDLAAGRIHGLLGRNGAGKSTLLGALASLRAPQAGVLRIDGSEPFEDERVMQGVALVRESGDVVPDEEVRTTLRLVARARPTFDRDYAEHLLGVLEVDPTAKPQEMSRGQRSALGALLGLATRAPLTMFDEVHLGMDAPTRQRFYDELLADFAAHPRTVIVSSHLIGEIEALLETVTILDGHGVLLSEEAEVLRARGLTLTGPAEHVAALSADHRLHVIGRRELGPTTQLTVFGDLPEEAADAATRAGLQLGAVPLQELFIHLTDHRSVPQETR